MTSVLSLIGGERQDAVSADMRRFYGTPLRDAVTTWTASDLRAAVTNLPLDSATVRQELGDLHDWNHLSANIAELVDLMHYWLHSEYQKWTYDPDDPKNKHTGPKVKPPTEPIIPPIAFRPQSIADQLVASYAKKLQEFESVTSGKQWVSSDDFDAAIE